MDAPIHNDGEFDISAYLYVPSSDTLVLDSAAAKPLPTADGSSAVLGRCPEWEELSASTQWALIDILCRLHPFAQAADLLGLNPGRVYEFLVMYMVEMRLWIVGMRTCVPEPLSSHEANGAKSFLRCRGLDSVPDADVEARVADAAPAADTVATFASLLPLDNVVTFPACDQDGSFASPPGFEWLDFGVLEADVCELFGRVTGIEMNFDSLWDVEDCEMGGDAHEPPALPLGDACATDSQSEAVPADGRERRTSQSGGGSSDNKGLAETGILADPGPASAAVTDRPSTKRNAQALASPTATPEPPSLPEQPGPKRRRTTAEADANADDDTDAAAAAAIYHVHSAAEAEFAAAATRASFALRAARIMDPPAALARRCRRAPHSTALPEWPAAAAARMARLRGRYAGAAAEGPVVQDATMATYAGRADWATYALSADEAYYAFEVSGSEQGDAVEGERDAVEGERDAEGGEGGEESA